ncbi:hypothetical protein D3C81_2081380 [compost metagenome]
MFFASVIAAGTQPFRVRVLSGFSDRPAVALGVVGVMDVSWPAPLKVSDVCRAVVLVGSMGERPSTRVYMLHWLLASLTK